MPAGVYEHKKGLKRKPCSEEKKKKISESKKGQKHSSEHKAKIGFAMTGKKNSSGRNLGNKYALGNRLSPETKMKIGFAQLGVKNNNWKGGITPIASQVRNSLRYAQWRTDVFIRDQFT